ncbi:hypothetical protein [Jiella mangrovi]|uniref:Uncharacterized protein n=1 Tax=Jiella mangrovi TaxID=2821407 RepID=A0ABS4BD76_9HYPH|nr:hypothetical protein [Jiella mangrovi]MBP0614136.1 hypothetical protein [Jiella mangrovi]
MANAAANFAHFDHPQHGTYRNPEDVLKDSRLSDGEKRTIIDEWRSSLKHILVNEPDAPEVEAVNKALDEAAAKL